MNRHRLLLRNVIEVHEDGNVYRARGVMPVRPTAGVVLECGHLLTRDEFNSCSTAGYQAWCQKCGEIPHSKTNPSALDRLEREHRRGE